MESNPSSLAEASTPPLLNPGRPQAAPPLGLFREGAEGARALLGTEPWTGLEAQFEKTPRFMITPHADAPLFNGPGWQDKLQYVLEEVSAGRYPATEAFLRLFRQVGLVNLWFFLKYILGYAGAYNKLNDSLHLSMCNFRQEALEPGTRSAIFVPRSTYKSTIYTHGGNTWELTRNPDIRIGVFCVVAERAQDFVEQTKRNIAENALFAELYPDHVPSMADGTGWTKRGAIMPNRRVATTEPSIRPCTAGGSTAGIHVDLASMDDLVSDDQLNADRGATADMISMRNWLQSNRHSLLISTTESRIILAATRYGLDDPYEEVMKDAREHIGYWKEIDHYYPAQDDGEWRVYYRMAKEIDESAGDFRSICPEQYTVEYLDKMAKSDTWTYQTQYMNNPIASSTIEFAKYTMPGFTLVRDDHRGWLIILNGDASKAENVLPLNQLDLIMALDPAASERFVSMKTSQTALVLLAQDSQRRKFIIDVKCGFIPTTKWFDWMFQARRVYPVRRTRIEQQAGFKSLESIIRREERTRGESLSYEPVNALGDKILTIRNIIEPELERGLLYINEAFRTTVEAELATFPASSRRDILDALKIAIKFSQRPESDEELEAYRERATAMYHDSRSVTTGY